MGCETLAHLADLRSVRDEDVRWMWEGLMRRDPNLYFEVGDAVARFDSTPWLASLEMPTMVIVNIEDQLMPSQAQYELASFFDDDVVELRGARHESIMNRGPDYVKLIDEFADRSRRCACRG